MTDRFVLHAPKDEIEKLFEVSSKREDYFDPDYNIAAGSLHPIIIDEHGGNVLQQARWGLIPPDADDERNGNENLSIPAERVRETDWLEDCLQQQRCLIPANGFYKWKTTDKNNPPFYIRLLSNQLTAFAGIYAVWESSSGRNVHSFAILTTKANTLIEPVDDRMPVLLQRSDFKPWLTSDEFSDQMHQQLLLKPYPLTRMAVNRVSKKVNDIGNNSPELIQPVPK